MLTGEGEGVVKRRCEGTTLVGAGHPYSRCLLAGSLEYDGHWYCKKHHPPTVEEYERERNASWEAKWAEQDKARAAAKREQALKDRALEWMRKWQADTVKQWEEEL